MIIYLSLAVCLVGALIYGFAANPKLSEVGRLMFACGMLVFLFVFAGAKSVAWLR